MSEFRADPLDVVAPGDWVNVHERFFEAAAIRAWGTYSAALRRPLLPTVMAGAAGLCVAVAMPVQAQEGTAPVAVFDQPREGLDPKGLDIGAFRLFPSLTVSETFDDHLFAAENGEPVALIPAVTGALEIRKECGTETGVQA